MLDALMAKWKSAHGNDETFIADGPINSDYWEQKDCLRIAWLLKEAHGDFSAYENSLTKWLSGETLDVGAQGSHDISALGSAKTKMWKKVMMASAGVLSALEENYQPYSAALLDESAMVSSRNTVMHHVAVANIKKTGGKPTSSWDDLAVFAKQDADLITEEVELLQADVLVCGYTLALLELAIENAKDTSLSILNPEITREQGFSILKSEKDGKTHYALLIDMYHPANKYIGFNMWFYHMQGITLAAKKLCPEWWQQVSHKH